MRRLSQQVFALFKITYIDAKRNFFADVGEAPIGAFLGEYAAESERKPSMDTNSEQGIGSLAQHVSSARSGVKSFVIYQLSNRLPPNGSGVGCGYYDESGVSDGGNIAKLMNEYAFDFCFNPAIQEDNVLHFLDHCLSHLSKSYFSGGDREGYFALKSGIPGGLDSKAMGQYWLVHREHIRLRQLHTLERCVFTGNYIASYRDDLMDLYKVLDELAEVTNVMNTAEPVDSPE